MIVRRKGVSVPSKDADAIREHALRKHPRVAAGAQLPAPESIEKNVATLYPQG